jgi:hypothetical protein
MDLAKLDTNMKAEEGVEMHLLHPVTNEDTGVVLVLRGSSSKPVKAALAKFRKISEDERKSEAEKDKAASEFLSKCIIEMRNVTYNGKKVESDAEGIRWFVERFQWAANQVLDFVNDIENFLPESDSE